MNAKTKTFPMKHLLSIFVLLAASFCSAQNKKLSSELNAALSQLQSSPQNSSQTINVVIQFQKGGSLQSYLNKVTGLGAAHKNSLGLIQGGVFQIPASLLPTLANDPDIAYISPDRQIVHTTTRQDWVLDATQVSSLSQSYDGSGIGVAVIDSGVRVTHPDLLNARGAQRVVYSQSFVPGDTTTDDAYGHGTHVAGILGGNGLMSLGWMQGMAPNVNIINLRVLDENGTGTDSAVIAAIQTAIQLKSTYNIRVINLSLGRPVAESYTLDPLDQAVEQAWKAGIVVVVAAGNDGRDNSANTEGYATITVPGNDPYVITVGATSTHDTDTTSDDSVTSYTSKGPTLLDHVVKPDLVAPGNQINSLLASGSTLDTSYPSGEIAPIIYGIFSCRPFYFVLSGTSMATPMVSGAVALMLQGSPSLTPDQVKIRLMKTATKSYAANTSATAADGTYYSLQDDIFTVGAGYLNASAAVSSTDMPTGSALSPIAMLNAAGQVYLKADPSSTWTTTSTWASSIVWGGNVLQANSIIWGNSIVWGNASLAGNSIIWGSSIVWGAGGGIVPPSTFSESTDPDNN